MTLFIEKPELLRGYRRAEPAVLELVYRTFGDQVAMLVRRGFLVSEDPPTHVPGIREPAEQCDLIQETFVRAFSPRARENFDGRCPLRPYLLRIAKNLMIDRFRRQQRESPLTRDSQDSGVGVIEKILTNNEPFEPLAPLLQAEQLKMLQATRDYLATVREPLKTFYRYRYQEGLNQLAAGRAMNLSRRRIRTLEHKLRLGLLSHLKSQGLVGNLPKF